jgi:large subunit ribosomal protein L15
VPARFKKKVRSMRGSHTHGWGEKKKHRGAGSRAGKGRSNWLASKKSLTYSYQKERVGKKGFVGHGPHAKEARTINLEQLERWAAANKAKEVDATKLGFDKVLGGGRLSMPLKVKARLITERAQMKIKQAGGVAMVESKAAAASGEESEEA